MSLYEEARAADVAPEDAVVVAHAFLRKLQAWAVDREIPKLAGRLQNDATVADAVKLQQWTTWRDFIEHALAELEDGTLDAWFGPHATPVDERRGAQ